MLLFLLCRELTPFSFEGGTLQLVPGIFKLPASLPLCFGAIIKWNRVPQTLALRYSIVGLVAEVAIKWVTVQEYIELGDAGQKDDF